MRNSIGILVPPANPIVEREFRGMLPESMDYYVARFPVLEGNLLSRLRGYDEALSDVAASFGNLDVEMILSACTGCAYHKTLESDRANFRELSTGLGVEIVSAPLALDWAFQKWEVDSLTILSPYPPTLTALAAEFWSEAGYDMVDVIQIPGTGLIYDLREEDVKPLLADAVAAGNRDQRHAFLVTGTGAPTMRAIDDLALANGVRLISSNLALGWYALDALGGGDLLNQAPIRCLSEKFQNVID